MNDTLFYISASLIYLMRKSSFTFMLCYWACSIGLAHAHSLSRFVDFYIYMAYIEHGKIDDDELNELFLASCLSFLLPLPSTSTSSSLGFFLLLSYSSPFLAVFFSSSPLLLLAQVIFSFAAYLLLYYCL